MKKDADGSSEFNKLNLFMPKEPEPVKAKERRTIYRAGEVDGAYEVSLNGSVLANVTMADTALGIVEFYVEPKELGPNGDLLKARKYGTVRVKRLDDQS